MIMIIIITISSLPFISHGSLSIICPHVADKGDNCHSLLHRLILIRSDKNTLQQRPPAQSAVHSRSVVFLCDKTFVPKRHKQATFLLLSNARHYHEIPVVRVVNSFAGISSSQRIRWQPGCKRDHDGHQDVFSKSCRFRSATTISQTSTCSPSSSICVSGV